MAVGGQRHATAALSIVREAGSRRVRKISPRPGFDPRTVQPIASRYNDRAMAAQSSVQ